MRPQEVNGLLQHSKTRMTDKTSEKWAFWTWCFKATKDIDQAALDLEEAARIGEVLMNGIENGIEVAHELAGAVEVGNEVVQDGQNGARVVDEIVHEVNHVVEVVEDAHSLRMSELNSAEMAQIVRNAEEGFYENGPTYSNSWKQEQWQDPDGVTGVDLDYGFDRDRKSYDYGHGRTPSYSGTSSSGGDGSEVILPSDEALGFEELFVPSQLAQLRTKDVADTNPTLKEFETEFGKFQENLKVAEEKKNVLKIVKDKIVTEGAELRGKFRTATHVEDLVKAAKEFKQFLPLAKNISTGAREHAELLQLALLALAKANYHADVVHHALSA